MEEKRVRDSYSEQVQILTQANINGYHRLFGGQLMEWIDIVAAVVARRHSGKNVTTAVVDTLTFQAPAHANDTVIICGYITYVRRTSMEVCTKTYVENLNGTRTLINTAYLVMVALDDEEKPTEVPRLRLETPEEEAEWNAAEKRAQLRKQRRKENFYQIADHRIFCEDAAGKLLAEITFPDADAHTACIDHTFVDDSLRGQGVAGELMRRAVALLTEQGKQVTATCSYAAHWLEKHQK